ncbi:MAG: LacI family DNA-binding transcriptional regulator [Caldilineaceae bacterium]
MKQRVTIRDVARAAGVSHQTVSRVINGSEELSPATRSRVLEAIQRLNYRPSRTARSLAMQRTQTVGLLVPNIANPYFAEIAHGAQEAARAQHYSVLLGNTNWEPPEELQLLHSLAAHPVDGIILCSARSSDEALTAFCDSYRPIVLGGRLFTHPNASLVRSDHASGMRLVIQHLQRQGHTKIAMLAGPMVAPTMSNALRLNEFRRAMSCAGLTLDGRWIVHGPLTMEGGYQSARHLFATVPEVTALCAHNDLVAIGAMKACREGGRRVPAECAVIGYNDTDLAAMVDPPLTTVRVDTFAVGRQQMQRLLEMIAQPEQTFPELILPVTELVERGSG